jgi:putative DNA primase/helicase
VTTGLLAAALAYQAAGCAVVPITTDGEKRPATNWKNYQTTPPTTGQITTWLANGHYDGFGTICGQVSGQLEMLELEGRAVAEGLSQRLAQALEGHGLADLWATLNGGHLEVTPSGGLHWLYRVDGPARRNLKLARRPATAAELAANPDDKIKVLIETRGEGGFTVLAPSAGRTHSTGRAWTLLAGGPERIPTITIDERDALHAICGLYDQTPVKEPPPAQHGAPSTPTGQRPGDDYNQRASWDDILTPRGWAKVRRCGRGWMWRRPGKNHGVSATTGQSADGADRLYVFSSSTEFETEKPYSKFAAHTLLEHGGDYAKAAKALSTAGYGQPPAEPVRDLRTLIAPDNMPANMPTSPATISSEPATYTRTDDGNANRLIDTYRPIVRYCPDRGQWLAWDGHKWSWDHAGTVNELARSIARQLPAEDRTDERHRANSLSARGLEAMTRVARTDPRIVAPLSHLDAQPYHLNTPNGIVDLRTGKLAAPDPAALHTRSTTIAPDPDSPTPEHWLRFLADTFAGDPDMAGYVQRLLGLSLIGEVLEQILPFAYGEGANGKTTLLGVVQRLAGTGETGYSISAPAELLLATITTPHAAQVAQLAGARLVVTSELDEGQRFAESKVKHLTGRDAISAQFMRSNWFTFRPTHTLWLLANHQPTVRSGGPAFWRRLKLVAFPHTVPADKRDPHLENTLVDEEGPAILNWLIQGATDYLTSGLAEPTSVYTATTAYERDQDTVARFVEETCETGDTNAPHMRARVADLRTAYETWCRSEGEQPITHKALTLALRSRYQVMSQRTMNARLYLGIRLLNPSSNLSSDRTGAGDGGWSA